MASSSRSFCRFSCCAARIFICLINSASKVVFYIFLLFIVTSDSICFSLLFQYFINNDLEITLALDSSILSGHLYTAADEPMG